MIKKLKHNHPRWAIVQRKPGTELRFINNRYYLYEYKTIYDKSKKRPKKITGALLGSITKENGFIMSNKRKLEKRYSKKIFSSVQCKEYGMAQLVMTQFKPYYEILKQAFSDDWKGILAICYCRFIYHCSLKNIPFRLAASFLPQLLKIKPFSAKKTSALLKRIGSKRDNMLKYMKSFIKEGEYMLMDITDIFCNSKHIYLARKGYNSRLQYDRQFNLLYIYSANNRMPIYYRLLPGNIRDVKAFKNSLLEAGLKDAIVIADKGFHSAANVSLLLNEKLRFILPLKRDNQLISYYEIEKNLFKKDACYFEHEKRIIWYKKFPPACAGKSENNLTIYIFIDEQLKLKEENDYLMRIKTHPEKYSIDKYHQIKYRFGTIALLSNLDDREQNIYLTYKSRADIEQMFDSMKNALDFDHTYMQNEHTLQGLMFINHIAMQWYQHLYIQLKEKKLLTQISVNDYIHLLTDVKKIRINDHWYLNEFTAYTQKLIDKLNIVLI